MKNLAKLVANKLPALKVSLKKLVAQDVLVGVPQEEAGRKDDSGAMNNATLAYIHDNGSPANNIPPRPFMAPGVEKVQDRIEKTFKSAAQKVLAGEGAAIDQALHKVGLVTQMSIKSIINAGVAPALSEATLRARARRGRKGAIAELANRKAGEAPSMGDAKPLVDTGAMRDSINYVLRKK